ncbi:MAG: hypothetical protein ABSG99_08845 [Sedimentisphaerales bacterium]
MRKSFSSSAKLCFLVLLAAVLLLAPSCKKSPEKKAPAPKQAQQQSPPSQTQQQTKEQAGKTTVAVPEPATSTVAAAPATSTAEGLVPIDINLPKPMFIGTPQNIQVPNLEKPLGKPRPPFLAPAGTKNVALGKPVASSDEQPIIGELKMITDGDEEAADGSYVELGPFLQNVTIDLGAEYDIYAILFWHYHKEARVYLDVVVQVADDPNFITNVRTLFNNDTDNSSGLGAGSDMHYVETYEGKLVDAKGVRARYVRLYSNGNSSNELNHYIEVEVFGTPVL